MEGMVFNIQRYSIHDGPGIRTTVFFKGCSLRCFWCHNPESMDLNPQIQIFPRKCISCGNCFEACPFHAHYINEGQRFFKREICRGCGECAGTCYGEALVLTGKMMTGEEIIKEVEKDRPFYKNSDGGVTFSGGEPLLQKEFLKALLMGSKDRGLHTAVDTAGNVPWQSFKEILPYTDLFLFDIKAYSEKIHKQATGAGNSRIIENLKLLTTENNDIWIRIPVIPDINDNMEEMEKISAYLAGLKRIKQIELLPYHQFGAGKYETLGMEYKAMKCVPPNKELMDRLEGLFIKKGLNVKRNKNI